MRNAIFSGVYQGKPAVLKIYHDPRFTDEPKSQIAFSRANTSKVLVAPKVYKYKVESPHQGWLIMEKLPLGSFFTQPVEDKEEFAHLYLEYRKNFPTKPHRPLLLAENLSADQFHIFRINRWLELAASKEAEAVLSGKKPLLPTHQFIPLFDRALDTIRQEFSQRKMIWCHGHFKPHELYKVKNKNLYYLIDFAHSKMYPEGYEFAFIIWADWLMSADWQMSYSKWKQGVDEWVEVFRKTASRLGIKKFERLIRASLVERLVGSILADVCASDRPEKENKKRLKLLQTLLVELLEK